MVIFFCGELKKIGKKSFSSKVVTDSSASGGGDNTVVGGHRYQNLHRHILQELLAAHVRCPPCTTVVCILWLPVDS